jgi:Uma2 family endonuclease
MIAPAKHRFSVEDYYRMAETGVLRSDARVELLDGEIIDMSPIGPYHGVVTMFLTEFFTAAAKRRWVSSVQIAVHLNDHSEPQPDFMLLKPPRHRYRNGHPQPKDVFLLVEISDTSLERDQEEKLPAYARSGIAEVWIVDLNEQVIEVYRQPRLAGYASKKVLSAGDMASPQMFPDVKVDVGELLKR